jgi:hypothetical protein
MWFFGAMMLMVSGLLSIIQTMNFKGKTTHFTRLSFLR